MIDESWLACNPKRISARISHFLSLPPKMCDFFRRREFEFWSNIKLIYDVGTYDLVPLIFGGCENDAQKIEYDQFFY